MKYFAALGIALLVIAAASVGPWAPSPFTSQTGTNTTAAAWRTALGAAASSTLSGYVTNHTGAATNLALTGGSVTTQTNTDLTASRVVVSSASKVLASSSVTSTTLGYLDATSSVQTQLDSKPTVALTNVALLSANQTFTGTNTLNTNTVLGTNRVGDFLGEGARWRRIYFGGPFTNEPASSTPATNLIATITLPPLLSPSSHIIWSALSWKTNVTSQPDWTVQFWANSTNGNLIQGSQILGASVYQPNSITSIGGSIINTLFRNLNSFSIQRPAGTNYTTPSPSYLLGWDTTAATNTIYIQLINSSATGTAPINIEFIELLERY